MRCDSSFAPTRVAFSSSITTADSVLPANIDFATPASAPASDLQSSSKTDVIHKPPHGKMPAGYTLTEPTISKSQPTRRHQNGLPIDLTWLVSKGVARSGIFKLMGLAKAAGKLLSDVVMASRTQLDALHGARLYAYLRALACRPSDFAMRAAIVRRQLLEERENDAQQRKANIFRLRFKGVALTNRSFTKLYVIDQRCEYVQVYARDRLLGSMPLNSLKEWTAGVETGKLVMVALAIKQQFPPL